MQICKFRAPYVRRGLLLNIPSTKFPRDLRIRIAGIVQRDGWDIVFRDKALLLHAGRKPGSASWNVAANWREYLFIIDCSDTFMFLILSEITVYFL